MSKFVMVIDDSPTVCKIIETSLRREGYEVKSFADGIQAMQWLLKPEARIPDLVFVDLCLPKLDGYEVIQSLKSKSAFARTTFVIISRRDGLVDKLKGRLAGARTYLTKPLKTQELLAIAHTYLGDLLIPG
jgi:twitching motility two-component system response regulator PilG